MNANQLIGRSVGVLAADLLGTSVNAVIQLIAADTRSLLLEFVPPVRIGTRTYPFAVACPRLQRDDLDTLLRNDSVGCAVTYVSSDRYDPAKPFNLTWWRGGGAVIADLVLT